MLSRARRCLSRLYSSGYLERPEFLTDSIIASLLVPNSGADNMSISDLETPCLVVDRGQFTRNMQIVKDALVEFPGVTVRPHAKAHKSADVALMQLDFFGEELCRGVCAQTVSEAQALVDGGVQNILVSNEVVDLRKMRRLAFMCCSNVNFELVVCVDDLDVLASIDELLSGCCQNLQISGDRFMPCLTGLIEVNIGQDRGGVDTTEGFFELLEGIEGTEQMEFQGIQAYHGNNQHTVSAEDRNQNCLEGIDRLVTEFLSPLEAAGVGCPTVTGGGTGDFRTVLESGVYNEIQPGSFIFMDTDYVGIEDTPFQESLFVLSSVVSQKLEVPEGVPRRTVLDCGSKGISFDCGLPEIRVIDQAEPLRMKKTDLQYVRSGDQHGRIFWPEPEDGNEDLQSQYSFSILETLVLVPSHCDPTVNKHSEMLFFDEDGIVDAVAKVGGQGPGH